MRCASSRLQAGSTADGRSPVHEERRRPRRVPAHRPRPRCGSSGSRCAPGCTRASASSWTARWPGSPCTSARGSRRRPSRARCSCRARSATSSPAPASASVSAARHKKGRPRGVAAICGQVVRQPAAGSRIARRLQRQLPRRCLRAPCGPVCERARDPGPRPRCRSLPRPGRPARRSARARRP